MPDSANKKVEILRENRKWVKEYLQREDIYKAKKSFDRILPGFC
jgi:hypothetical protein